MISYATASFSISDSSQVSEARRAAAAIAADLGCNETDQGRVALVVTELATNLVRHTTAGGELLLRPLSGAPSPGLELLSLDRGPGMWDLRECLRDGFSTAGSQGIGLGAISRLSSLFEVYTRPGEGTALLCQVWAQGKPPPPEPFELGVICLATRGEELPGDGWAVALQEERALFLVVDGVGHGPLAFQAADQARRAFASAGHLPLPELMNELHYALRATRGAAGALACLPRGGERLCYAGVGNISGALLGPEGGSSHLVSHNGTLGFEQPRVQEFESHWPEEALLVMHSDGLGTQWRMDRYPGLSARHPALIAGVLYRDFYRGRDDVTVLVARRRRG